MPKGYQSGQTFCCDECNLELQWCNCKTMSEREMFEKSFERPKNYFKLSALDQWDIDQRLGILDWQGNGLTEVDIKRFKEYYVG